MAPGTTQVTGDLLQSRLPCCSFSIVLANRLSAALALNNNQRGFRHLDGTMANIIIFDSFLREPATDNKTSAVMTLDITKAFDTVPHASILRGIQRMGLDVGTNAYIMDALQNNTRKVKVKGNTTTSEITFMRGVRQGEYCLIRY